MILDKIIETKKTVRFEGTLDDGVFENSLYPVFDKAGNVRCIAVYVRDITERKRLEDKWIVQDFKALNLGAG